ncbi:hypothetical protein VTK26DRAFT_4440 [Humicola hyalothermophila]
MPSANHHNQSPAPGTYYDPACDTVVFDVLVILTMVGTTQALCGHCKQTVMTTARRACEKMLLDDFRSRRRQPTQPSSTSTSSQSQIRRVRVDDRVPGRIVFATTLDPTLRGVLEMATVRAVTDPARHRAMVERAVDALWRAGDDTWNLRQAQLWYVLRGSDCSVVDAVTTRVQSEGDEHGDGAGSLASYGEGFLALMSAVRRAEEQARRELGRQTHALRFGLLEERGGVVGGGDPTDVPEPPFRGDDDWRLMCPDNMCFYTIAIAAHKGFSGLKH